RARPARGLPRAPRQAGREEDAPRVILRFAPLHLDTHSLSASNIDQRLNNLAAMAAVLRALYYPFDALRIYRELVQLPDRLQVVALVLNTGLRRQAEESADSITKRLLASSSVETTLALLAPANLHDKEEQVIDLL